MRGFFEKKPVDEALEIILSKIKPLPSECIKIAETPGRVLAQEVVAGMDIPPFDRSAMDGYAVRGEGIPFISRWSAR
jgi:molybdopterin molybdotransferase